MSNKVHPHHFSAIEKILITATENNTEKYIYFNTEIYIGINFSLRSPCYEIDYGRTQNWKIVPSFCAKVLLRIISILLIVLWQVLKPPIRKAIFKRILRQRFFIPLIPPNGYIIRRRATLFL